MLPSELKCGGTKWLLGLAPNCAKAAVGAASSAATIKKVVIGRAPLMSPLGSSHSTRFGPSREAPAEFHGPNFGEFGDNRGRLRTRASGVVSSADRREARAGIQSRTIKRATVHDR